MFFGKCDLSLNEKNQVTLPSNFREAATNSVFVTQGFDRNLLLLTQKAFSSIYSHIKEISISDPMARLLSRLFLGSAVEIQVDNLGMVELPASLCEYAILGKDIVVIGQGEYSEIWSSMLWQKQMDSLKDYDANSHRFEKFHVSLS